jgi:hypothetical protein
VYPTDVICPVCSCPVDIRRYGEGWIGICCNKVCYNSDRPPSFLTPPESAKPTQISVSDQLAAESPLEESERD